jgi:hypothetical protein
LGKVTDSIQREENKEKFSAENKITDPMSVC